MITRICDIDYCAKINIPYKLTSAFLLTLLSMLSVMYRIIENYYELFVNLIEIIIIKEKEGKREY